MTGYYSLADSLEAAWEELSKLDQKLRPQVNLIARKHAPNTIRQIQSLVAEYDWILALESSPGLLLEDSISATVAAYIANVLAARLYEEQQREQMEQVKKDAIRAKIAVPKLSRGK